jgi:thiosulfate dehydrogenase [quinone] large subunit
MERRTNREATKPFPNPACVDAVLGDVRFAWFWLVVRTSLGWWWIETGWPRMQHPSGLGGGLGWMGTAGPIGLTLAGIALVLGALTSLAAFAGGCLGGYVASHGGTWTEVPWFAASVVLVLSWKTAGWIGLDRWLLPVLGMPWRGGALFPRRRPLGRERRTVGER